VPKIAAIQLPLTVREPSLSPSQFWRVHPFPQSLSNVIIAPRCIQFTFVVRTLIFLPIDLLTFS